MFFWSCSFFRRPLGNPWSRVLCDISCVESLNPGSINNARQNLNMYSNCNEMHSHLHASAVHLVMLIVSWTWFNSIDSKPCR